MPLIPYPDVPNDPGVPPVAQASGEDAGDDLSADSYADDIGNADFTTPVWGIYDKVGNEALKPDSFLGIDYRQDTRVSNYPQEKGAFASYNKVQTPFDCRVRLAIGGTEDARTQFLATVDGMTNSIDLFSVVTPEVTYPSAALQSYNYHRDDRGGVTLLTVELDFIEVRQTAQADASEVDQPQDPGAADPVSDGQVQATPVSQSTVNAVDLPPLPPEQPAPTPPAPGSPAGPTGTWQTATPQTAWA